MASEHSANVRVAHKRIAVPAPARSNARINTIPAPIRGWVAAANRAAPPPQSAIVLKNWFPTTTGIRLGGTSTLKATIGTTAVESQFTYDTATVNKHFAANTTSIFDITSVADPAVAPAADVTGQTSGYYTAVPFTTSGGSFLTVVNGDDEAQLYDGSTWQAINAGSSPAITGVLTSTFSQGWVYRNREYFVESGTQSAWYLPVDSIGGAATEIALSGVFKLGGALLFGATWSLDAGDGVDDKCVFVSTEGEVAVYEGSFPDGADWRLVGRYDMAKPMGKNGHVQIAGDLLILAEAGVIPISQVIQKDPAALSLAAVSRAIEPEWKKEVIARRALPWEIVKWSPKNMLLVSLPVTTASNVDRCFPVNAETGAWCEYAWNTRSLTIFDDWLYFGTNSGTVHQAEVGGSHSGALVYHEFAGHAEHLGAVGAYKTVTQVRARFLSSVSFDAKLSISVDYQVSFPTSPNAVNTGVANEWDVGLWDQAKWDQAGLASSITARWVSAGVSGEAFYPQIQVTSGSTRTPDTELVTFDFMSEMGGVVV